MINITNLGDSICSYHLLWGNKSVLNLHPTSWPRLVNALTAQESIGWKLFMEGCNPTSNGWEAETKDFNGQK